MYCTAMKYLIVWPHCSLVTFSETKDAWLLQRVYMWDNTFPSAKLIFAYMNQIVGVK